MAVSGKIRVSDLFAEFLADTLIFLRPLEPAGTISAGTLEPFFDGGYHFLVFIQPDSHAFLPFLNRGR